MSNDTLGPGEPDDDGPERAWDMPRADTPPRDQLDDRNRQYYAAIKSDKVLNRTIRINKLWNRQKWQGELRRVFFIIINLAVTVGAIKLLRMEGLSASEAVTVTVTSVVAATAGLSLRNLPGLLMRSSLRGAHRREDNPRS